MTKLANIQTPGTILSVRETEYRTFREDDGILFQYTEVHSDGIRAISAEVSRGGAESESYVTVKFARVDSAESMTDVDWVELEAVTSPAFVWFTDTEPHSEWAAPKGVVGVARMLVARALHVLCWDV